MTSDDDPLLRFRERFPITQRTNYLISNSLGAMPHAARAAVGQFLDMWDTRGVRAWAEGWWVLQEQVGAVLERAIGVGPSTISMHQNIAVALEMILS